MRQLVPTHHGGAQERAKILRPEMPAGRNRYQVKQTVQQIPSHSDGV
jgi:hypothetical protein